MSGCIIFTPLLWIFADDIIGILEKLSNENAMRIAYFHLVFNITTALITTPLIKYLVLLVQKVIKHKEPPKEYIEWFIKDKEPLLDSRPSSTSINLCMTNDLISEDNLLSANHSENNDDLIHKNENIIKPELFRKESSELSDKENEDNKNHSKDNIIEINNEEDKKEEIIEEKKPEIKEEIKEDNKKLEDDKKEEEKIDEEKKEENKDENNLGEEEKDKLKDEDK